MQALLTSTGVVVALADTDPGWNVPAGCSTVNTGTATATDYQNATPPPNTTLTAGQPVETYWDATAQKFYQRNRALTAAEQDAQQRSNWQTQARAMLNTLTTQGWDALTPDQRTQCIVLMCRAINRALQ